MNYVESLNLFGVEAMQIPCIPGKGAPTTATEGAVGCLYMDTATATGDLYKCTAILPDGGYKWDRLCSSWADLGESIITTVLADNQVFSTAETDGAAAILPFLLKQGATYDVVCQGVPYTGLPVKSIQLDDGLTYIYLGNLAVGAPGMEDTGEDFVILSEDTASALVTKEPAENITLSLTEHAPGVLPLPQKYAPEIKRFYWNTTGGDLPNGSTGYLYLDKECTIKASKADLVECRTAFCLVREADERLSYGTIHFPLYVMYENDKPYALCVIRYVDTDYTFVTSEFVPE